MLKPFKKFTTQILTFSRSDRNALLILCILILIVLVVKIIIKKTDTVSSFDISEYADIIRAWDQENSDSLKVSQSLFYFDPNTIGTTELDSLNLPDFIKRNFLSYRKAGAEFNSPEDFRKVYGMNDSIYSQIKKFIWIAEKKKSHERIDSKAENKRDKKYFDPNSADVSMLEKLGFNNIQLSNLIKYRERGGSIKNKSDLKKIYGIDSAFYSSIEQYIKIDSAVIRNEPSNKTPKISFQIEVNSADSINLIKLKGIGPIYASRIIKYRNILGGFYNKEQLLEVYNFPEETFNRIKDQVYIDTTLIKKIRVNFIEYSELLSHPYLGHKDVQTIMNFKKNNGALVDMQQVRLVLGNDSVKFNRIRPYITCR